MSASAGAGLLSRLSAKLDVETNIDLTPTGEPKMIEEDEETLASTCSGVSFVLGDGLDAGTGTLYLTTRRVIWISSSTSSPAAFALRYQQIVMHAISRDVSTYALPCLYLQLDEGSEDMMGGQDEEDEEAEVDELEDQPAEVKLVPQEESKVDELFKVLCECAALNPDAEPEEEGVGDFFFDEAEVMAGLDDDTRAALVAQQMANNMDLEGGEGDLQELVGADPSRFEDDDDEDDEQQEDIDEDAQQVQGNGHV